MEESVIESKHVREVMEVEEQPIVSVRNSPAKNNIYN